MADIRHAAEIAAKLDAGQRSVPAEDVGKLIEFIGQLQAQIIDAQSIAIERGKQLIELRQIIMEEAAKERGMNTYIRVLERSSNG